MEVLTIVAWVFLGIGILSCIIVYLDINMGRYQSMGIMNVAWVITSIYMGVLGLFMYFRYARASKAPMNHGDHAGMSGMKEHSGCGAAMSKSKDHSGCGAAMMKAQEKPKKPKPLWVQVFISSTHCGAGCGLGDIVSETLIYFTGITLWGATIWASFFIDYAFALAFGLFFQYLNIKPMKPNEPTLKVIWDAINADVLSLTSFQLGMYAWTLAMHYIFKDTVEANSAFFWFVIQIGLILGLFTTYPVNYLLIKTGVKVPCA